MTIIPAAPRLDEAALQAIVAGLATVPRTVPADERTPGQPRSLRLLGTDDYDVWLITWPVGSGQDRHDHGPALSVLGVVEGWLDGDRCRLGPGRSITVAPGEAHRLSNPGPGDATSIHAYAPPLLAVGYHDPPIGSGPGRRWEAPVRSKRAEASAPAATLPDGGPTNQLAGRRTLAEQPHMM